MTSYRQRVLFPAAALIKSLVIAEEVASFVRVGGTTFQISLSTRASLFGRHFSYEIQFKYNITIIIPAQYQMLPRQLKK